MKVRGQDDLAAVLEGAPARLRVIHARQFVAGVTKRYARGGDALVLANAIADELRAVEAEAGVSRGEPVSRVLHVKRLRGIKS